jgi:hypothetical protein
MIHEKDHQVDLMALFETGQRDVSEDEAEGKLAWYCSGRRPLYTVFCVEVAEMMPDEGKAAKGCVLRTFVHLVHPIDGAPRDVLKRRGNDANASFPRYMNNTLPRS